MGNEPKWKAERQPAWLIKAIRKTIAGLAGGYSEAAEILDVTEDAVHNRLRSGGDQLFPIGWSLVLQQAVGSHHIVTAIAKTSGGVFMPLPDVELVDYGDINQRLLEAIEQITRYSQQVRAAIEDGVVEPHEREIIDEELHRAITKLQEHTTLVYRVFCAPEK
ncbi:YmfL family putative regulatory protein [Pantoea sp. 9140]|uniref:YmfL family putative regulatory protein n=1 Tax=Pantoea sp. 9140 TaxID=1500896 RepID=UPI0005347318|nr:YmfL family putative regulatory protein [Pantoea sp. 9140]